MNLTYFLARSSSLLFTHSFSLFTTSSTSQRSSLYHSLFSFAIQKSVLTLRFAKPLFFSQFLSFFNSHSLRFHAQNQSASLWPRCLSLRFEGEGRGNILSQASSRLRILRYSNISPPPLLLTARRGPRSSRPGLPARLYYCASSQNIRKINQQIVKRFAELKH